MPESKMIFRTLLGGAIFASCVSIGFSQGVTAGDPSQKPRTFKKEPDKNDVFKKWVSEDVSLIITPAEKRAYDALKNNEERENFIGDFWRRRDPSPDTEENEYREEYYERIEYANEHFSSGLPGSRTDRGKIYIARGKPDSVESHPSGGSYDRPSYEGGGSTTTYPFETWFYRHLDGVGDGVEIEFVDPTGTGEYHIARNADEKSVLTNVPGLGQKTLGDNPETYQRQQDTPFERLRIESALQQEPPIRYSGTTVDTLFGRGTGVIQNEYRIGADLQIDFFRQSDDRVIAAFTVQTDNTELAFRDISGVPTAKINITGRLTAVSGRTQGFFEDSVSTTATTEGLSQGKSGRSIYQKAYPLAPGTYKIQLAVRDIETGKTGTIEKGFTVPRYDSKKLSTSTLILASRLYQTADSDIGGRFVIGDKKVIPNVSSVYRKGQEVGIYLQVYNSGVDQTTLRPSVDVDYILTRDGREVMKQTEDWSGLSDSSQRLTLARLLSTEKLSPGEYQVKIRIRDRVTDKVLEPTQTFTIIP